MITRSFPPLGRDVSVLGFGGWQIAGEFNLGRLPAGWGATDPLESAKAIDRAIDCGINFFDTADVYGMGVSEKLIGNALSRHPDLIVCTKFGTREIDGKIVKDFSKDWLAASVEGSLHRLGRDWIDVLLLHSPPDDFDWSRFDRGPLDRLVKQGRLRSYGVSVRSYVGAERAMEAGFRTVELIYNALDRRAEERVFPLAREMQCVVIARVPLASGFLSGRYTEASTFPANDFRSQIPVEDRAWRIDASRRLQFLAENPEGVIEGALRFCISAPEVTTVVVGMRSANQVELNCRAVSRGPLPPSVLDRIRTAVPEPYYGWR